MRGFMPMVCEYLEQHSPTQLLEEHGVNIRVSTRDPRVFTLNYDQIRVRNDDALASQCRGLVLRGGEPVDEAKPVGPTLVLARPFDRFFNLGQPECADVDFAHAVFYEKLDGTFCIVYFDDRRWPPPSPASRAKS